MRVAQLCDDRVDGFGLVGAGGEFAHPGEASGCTLVVLGAGVDEFVFDESPMDREHGQWVDRFVRLGQLGPGVVVVLTQGRSLLPREAGILQRVEREQHGLIRSRCQCGEDLVAVVGP